MPIDNQPNTGPILLGIYRMRFQKNTARARTGPRQWRGGDVSQGARRKCNGLSRSTTFEAQPRPGGEPTTVAGAWPKSRLEAGCRNRGWRGHTVPHPVCRYPVRRPTNAAAAAAVGQRRQPADSPSCAATHSRSVIAVPHGHSARFRGPGSILGEQPRMALQHQAVQRADPHSAVADKKWGPDSQRGRAGRTEVVFGYENASRATLVVTPLTTM